MIGNFSPLTILELMLRTTTAPLVGYDSAMTGEMKVL